jgi:uncharacterized LabA/DUF88 family protein
MPEDRIAVFIDGGYFDKLNLRELGRISIQYDRLVTKIARGVDILRVYYYHCTPYQGSPPSSDERERLAKTQKFFSAVSRLPRFELRLGKLRLRDFECSKCKARWKWLECPHPKCRHKDRQFFQKRVDSMLATDLTALSATHMITHAAIVAGDSDFIPAVEHAKRFGVQIWLFHGGPKSPAHGELVGIVDEKVKITPEWIRDCSTNWQDFPS